MQMRRRKVLLLGAAAMASVALPRAVSLARGALGGSAAASCKTLICVHLRGGADGLSLLVPHGDAAYYRARKQTAVAAPGAGPDAALDLDGSFGLHPRLAALAALFARGELALWPAVGWNTPERSHSGAERRLHATLQTLAGERRVVSFSERGAVVSGTRAASGERLDLAAQLEQVAQRIASDVAPALACVQMSGWDVHVAQGGAAAGGRMADQLESLAGAVLGFRARLAAHWQDVAVAVVSEFGRSIAENTTSGTDDGHASAVLVLGGQVDGGRVHGRWPGLASCSSAGLTPTTDMQQLLASLVPS